MNAIGHFKTITRHRHLVCRYCFRLGLISQGLRHDLSKYSPAEFLVGAKYYQGSRSPNDVEREETGVSRAWLHHKGVNKHHLEYWVDYVINPDGSVGFGGNKMPLRFIAEMFCDRIAASRVYMGEKYTDASPYNYYANSNAISLLHPETAAELEKMLLVLRDEGEDAAFAYVRKRLREDKEAKRKTK